MKNVIEGQAVQKTELETLELKANLNPEQREYLDVLKAKMKKVLGGKTKQELANAGNLGALKSYQLVLRQILDFLKTKEISKKYTQEKMDKNFQEKAFKYIKSVLEENKVYFSSDPSYVARLLTGLDLESAWEMRDDFMAKDKALDGVAQSLAGLASERAWKMRRKLMDRNIDNDLALGLTGLESEAAWEMREDLLAKGVDIDYIIQSLAGLDSEQAWKMRDDYVNKFKTSNALAISLIGLDSERAWKMRELIKNAEGRRGKGKEDLVISIIGSESDKAWQIRKPLLKNNGTDEALAADSLAGLDSDLAWQARDMLIKNSRANYSLAQGLAGLDSERAWKMRADILKNSTRHNRALSNIMVGLYGDYKMAGLRKARADREG